MTDDYGVHDRLAHAERELSVPLDLRDILTAIGGDTVFPHYQPVVLLESRRVTGMEALARWDDPLTGPLAPLAFVPRLEQARRVSDLTARMLERVCRDAARWIAARALPEDFLITVNVSAIDLDDDRLAQLVAETLNWSGVPASLLCLEITETAVLDLASARVAIDALRAMGMRIAVDDYGAGHQGPDVLANLPIDLVKIDRRYVTSIATNATHQTFVADVVSYAHRRGMGVIAEGVEYELQASRLLELGCTIGQGFGLGRPGPGDAVVAALVVPSPL